MVYKDFVKWIQDKISQFSDKNKKINIIKEELQKNILYSIYSRENNIYFMWWTNLRICYELDRFSEDLDFVLDEPNKKYEIKNILNWIINDLEKERWYSIDIKIWNIANVQKAMIKFPNILFDTWVSNLKDEKITIKLEIDTNPASWAKYSNEIIKSTIWTFIIKNESIDSTFSWKIWAILLRKYTKWRDYYDIYWYLNNYFHKAFNLKYLWNIITQYNQINNEKIKIPKSHKEALNMLLEIIEKTDYSTVKSDLIRFVSWDKKLLDTFFINYKEKMFDIIKKYNSNLEGINKWGGFRL